MRTYILVACLWLATNPLWGKIVFDTRRHGGLEVYTMNADGSNPTRVTNDPTDAGSPTWSPNGQQIAFHSTRGGQMVPDDNIWVIDVDGKNLRQLTFHPKGDNYPDWSPDGNQIAFDSDRTGKDKDGWPTTEIFVMDANGGNVKQVTEVGFASRPRWSPDGKRILFEGLLTSGRQVYAFVRWYGNVEGLSNTVDAGMFRRVVARWEAGFVCGGNRFTSQQYDNHHRHTSEKPDEGKIRKSEEVPLPKMPAVQMSVLGQMANQYCLGRGLLLEYLSLPALRVRPADEFHRNLDARTESTVVCPPSLTREAYPLLDTD